MIRREAKDEYWLIAQHDHARLAGELGRCVGNGEFAGPQPSMEVLAAIAGHDCGWQEADAQPDLNEKGQPVDVFETPPEISLPAWSASVDRMAEGGAYAGLLVSLHVLALSALAADPDAGISHGESQMRHRTARQTFELNKFQHRQIEIQEALRRRLGMQTDNLLTLGVALKSDDPQEKMLERNLRLLQAMDLLSLGACCTHVPTRRTPRLSPRAGEAAASLTMRREGDDMVVDPWPFDRPVIPCRIEYRAVEKRTWHEAEVFRRTFAESPRRMLEFSVRKAQ